MAPKLRYKVHGNFDDLARNEWRRAAGLTRGSGKQVGGEGQVIGAGGKVSGSSDGQVENGSEQVWGRGDVAGGVRQSLTLFPFHAVLNMCQKIYTCHVWRHLCFNCKGKYF